MSIINENEEAYRFGDSGPKFLLRGPRMNFGLVVLQPGHEIMGRKLLRPRRRVRYPYRRRDLHLPERRFHPWGAKKVHYLVNKGEEVFKAAFMLAP
jgi:hypothetical protein